ncbi:SOS response-associated peptidase family protein [Synechococcus sp. H65.1]|uniref:SOS response-associated peptidase family protein n=1 Tax=Synechococcus sp. H65.1 TaxID=2964525 RepID=UPI0039C31B03
MPAPRPWPRNPPSARPFAAAAAYPGRWLLRVGRPTAKRQSYGFYLLDRPVFAFAGIWERWRSSQGVERETCAILNTPANRLMKTTTTSGGIRRGSCPCFAPTRQRPWPPTLSAPMSTTLATRIPLAGLPSGKRCREPTSASPLVAHPRQLHQPALQFHK